MDLSKFTYDKVFSVFKLKDYSFDPNPYSLNIFGVRSANPIVNQFCDCLGVIFTDDKLDKLVFTGIGTTEPGLYWLMNPMNIKGTFIMKEGHYPACWSPGLFEKSYTALLQVGNLIGYRDGARNGKFELVPGDEVTGSDFGVCMHTTRPDQDPSTVGLWSAGCQVWQDYKKFQVFMALVNQQIAHGWGNTFSYSLFNETDFNV